MTPMIKPFFAMLVLLLAASAGNAAEEGKVEAIDQVWSAHRVLFDFVGHGSHQVVAYYDASRQMSVAYRASPATTWRYHKLPSYLGWDSHNAVVVGIDEAGYFHVAGNMHTDPLVYFRSSEPFDVRTLKQEAVMAGGQEERQVTYPQFFNGPDGRLYFKHRYGTSGNGVEIYKVFDTKTLKWRQLHQSAFVDGEGERNGYFVGPTLERDGMFHLAWVWRETPSANTNHDLSYARSKDLVNWESSDGSPLPLPIRLRTAEVVDDVQEGGGLLNGHTPLALDANGRPMVVYQKYGSNGNSQVFLSRRESSGWKSRQVSDIDDYRADLDRYGALALDLDTNIAPFVDVDNNIIVRARLRGENLEFVVDHETLAVMEKRSFQQYPKSVIADDVENNMPLLIRPLMILGEASSEWFIAWEAQRRNRDRARETISAPTTLRLHYVPVE